MVNIKTYFQHTLQLLCLYIEVDFTGNHVGNTDADILRLEVQHHQTFALSPEEPLKELTLAGQYQLVALDLEHCGVRRRFVESGKIPRHHQHIQL